MIPLHYLPTRWARCFAALVFVALATAGLCAAEQSRPGNHGDEQAFHSAPQAEICSVWQKPESRTRTATDAHLSIIASGRISPPAPLLPSTRFLQEEHASAARWRSAALPERGPPR